VTATVRESRARILKGGHDELARAYRQPLGRQGSRWSALRSSGPLLKRICGLRSFPLVSAAISRRDTDTQAQSGRLGVMPISRAQSSRVNPEHGVAGRQGLGKHHDARVILRQSHLVLCEQHAHRGLTANSGFLSPPPSRQFRPGRAIGSSSPPQVRRSARAPV